MKYSSLIVLCLLFLILFASCTATPQDIETCREGEPVGLLYGLWHGLIAPITFIISLFTDSVSVYAVNNSGGWYDFGFLLGVGAFSSSAGRASKR